MTEFSKFNDIIFKAFCLNPYKQEIVDKKTEIISRVAEHWRQPIKSILFIGFNPAMLSKKFNKMLVTQVSPEVTSWLTDQGVDFELVDMNNIRPVDLAVALDEFLTFAEDDLDQQRLINQISKTARTVITTVKDYKNQEFKDREYSQPAIIRNDDEVTAFTEIHIWDRTDKNNWQTRVYELNKNDSINHGNFNRRALFFKQLAKFTKDAGAKNFLVHKNLMYKSLIKKNYEHVISIRYED
jgi:hypothetical protein